MIYIFILKKKKKKKYNYIKLLRVIILLLNFYLFFINSIIIMNNFNKIIKSTFIIKNVDYFIFKIFDKEFINISYYLNNKYFNNGKILPKKISSKKTIFLDCVDLFRGQKLKNWIINSLGNQFSFIFDSNNPDYLIYNKFGSRHLDPKYNKSIKIAFFTENKIPDLNEVDYALGFSHINYLDRFYMWHYSLENFFNVSLYKIIRKNNILKNLKKKKFCAAVISNQNAFFRNKFIKELNKYKTVDMGGKYNNNVGGSIKDKIEFLSAYKFSLAMENSEADGYTSEKIFNSFISGTIPIYFGNYMIDEYINPNSFILIKSEKDMLNKIEFIKKIDNDDELYKKILKEKIFNNNINFKEINNKENKEKKNFFLNIFNQDKSYAFRRNN